MEVMHDHWRGDRFVFDKFHSHPIWKCCDRNAIRHLNIDGRKPLLNGGKILHLKADVIDCRTIRARRRLSLRENDEYAGKPQQFERSGPCDFSTHRTDPDFLLYFGIFNQKVDMPYRYTTVVWRRQLSVRRQFCAKTNNQSNKDKLCTHGA